MDGPSPPESAADIAFSKHGTIILLIIGASTIAFFAFFFCIIILYLKHTTDRRRRRIPAAGLASLSFLPIFVFSSVNAVEEEEPECSICLVEFAEGEEVRLLPVCGHRFHVKCIDEWFVSNDTCPICRATVSATPAAALPASQPERNLRPARAPLSSSSSSSACYEHRIELSRV